MNDNYFIFVMSGLLTMVVIVIGGSYRDMKMARRLRKVMKEIEANARRAETIVELMEEAYKEKTAVVIVGEDRVRTCANCKVARGSDENK